MAHGVPSTCAQARSNDGGDEFFVCPMPDMGFALTALTADVRCCWTEQVRSRADERPTEAELKVTAEAEVKIPAAVLRLAADGY